jgi:hypothetical protein
MNDYELREHDRDQAEQENKRLRDALLRLMLPYQALLLDTPSRRWICPDIWNNIETAMKEAWKVLR